MAYVRTPSGTAAGSGAIRNIAAGGATTGSADNATIIQAAINEVATAGGGTVLIPKGTWTTGPLKMRTGVRLQGEGAHGTTLKLKNGSNTHLISLNSPQEMWTGMSDLVLDGNKENQTVGDVVRYDQGRYTNIDNTSLITSDPNHYFLRVVFVRGKGNGFYSFSDTNSAFQMVDCLSIQNDGVGFYIASPDNMIDHCITAGNGFQGFAIPGNQNRLMGCKSFINGQITASAGIGFDVSGDRQSLIHCEAQENRSHGFSIVGVQDSIFIVQSERNGLGAGGNPTGGAGDGMYAQGTTNCEIHLQATDRLISGVPMQRWGYNLGDGNDGNIVTITGGRNATGTAGIGSWGPNSLVAEVFAGKPVPRAASPLPTAAQTRTNYTFVAADAGSVVEGSNASAQIYTVPPSSAVAFPVGTQIIVRQMGTGPITLAPGSAVTLRSRGALLKVAGQYGQITLTKRATDEWVVAGDAA